MFLLSDNWVISFKVNHCCHILQGKSTEIKCECLEIFCDVLHRFGSLMTKDHAELLNALLSQLESNQTSIRKKSIACTGE